MRRKNRRRQRPRDAIPCARFTPEGNCPHPATLFTRSNLPKSYGITPRHRAWCASCFNGPAIQHCIRMGALTSVSYREWVRLNEDADYSAVDALIIWRDSLALDWYGDDLISHIRAALSDRSKNVPPEHQEGLRLFLQIPEDKRYKRIAKVLYPNGNIPRCW